MNGDLGFHSTVRLEPEVASAIVSEYALLLESIHGVSIYVPADSDMVAVSLRIGLHA